MYYTDQIDKLIESADEAGMKQVETRCTKIIDNLTELISETEMLKEIKVKQPRQ